MIWYRVRDLDAARAFYAGTLGFAVDELAEDWVRLSRGRTVDRVAEGEPDPEGGVAMIDVDDIEARPSGCVTREWRSASCSSFRTRCGWSTSSIRTGTGSSSARTSGRSVIRRGGPHDVPFLRDMLHHAYYWRENAPEMEDLPVSRYVLGWGRRGDASVVAIEDAWPVGAAGTGCSQGGARLRVRRRGDAELSIAVVPSKRARGHGFMMLKALMDRAREDGFDRLSLSVEPDNPSIALYERFGFRKVGERNGTTTMVADLNAPG